MRNSKKQTKTEEPKQDTVEQKIENDNTEPLGVLFDRISYYKSSDLDNFMNNLSREQSLYCILQACESAYKRKAYTLVESELLSKALRILTQE